jgi:CBS domain-containing protein
MPQSKKVQDLMIPLEDYPHMPYWFNLRQAIALIRESALKFEGSFEPRAVLVFDEKYQLMGILTYRDIIKGLEPRFFHETALIKADASLATLTKDFSAQSLKEASQKQVSEIMSPIKITVKVDDPITKAMFIMIKEGVGLMPVMSEKKVVGMISMSSLFKEMSDLVMGD